MNPSHTRSITALRKGFTVIELLVVVGAILILIAILLPVLAKAKRNGNQISCLNNVRQLSLASLMYLNDNAKPMPYKDPDFPGGTWMATITKLISNRKVMLCPSAPVKEPAPPSGNRIGSADEGWVRWTDDGRTKFSGSYGYNAWLYSDLNKYYKVDSTRVFSTEALVAKPAQTPMFVDANWVDLSPGELDLPWTNLYTGASYLSSKNQMGRCTIARHGSRSASSAPRSFATNAKLPGAIVMGFADGAVSAVPLENLWNYSWHASWQPPAARPQ